MQPIIYGIKNLINEKIYVGKSINIKLRKKAHENSFIRKQAVNIHLQRAVDKYGIENFEFVILEEVILNNINDKEQYWIAYFKSYDENFGYNKTMGGDGGNLTIETKLKISKTSPNRKIIYQFSKEGELIRTWNGVRDAEREFGFLSSTISKACSSNTNNNSAYGFYWSYDENLNILHGIGQQNNKFKVQQISLDGELIKIWDSISLASKETTSSKSSIIRCCKNKQKTCNNFIWKYSNN
jgi:group I intron endonuclease